MRVVAWAALALLLAGCEEHAMSRSGVVLESRPDAPTAAAPETTGEQDAIAGDQPAVSETPVPPTPGNKEPAKEEPASPPEDPFVAAKAAGGVLDVSFDDIKFDIEKDGKFERKMLTPKIEGYADKTLKIRGYILPSSVFRQTGNTSFVLVRDNQECCFGPGAALYDCVVVDMLPGKSADFSTRPVAVEGTFAIKEFLDFDGVVRAIYHLDGKSVK